MNSAQRARIWARIGVLQLARYTERMSHTAKNAPALQPICSHPSWVEINLRQFRANLAAIRKKIGSRLLCVMVKANAYGHGLCEIGQVATKAGADYLVVSCLKEEAMLRAS